MKNYTSLGVLAGLVLAFFIYLGVWYVVLAVLLAAIGGVVGAHFDSRIDLTAVWKGVVGQDRGQG
ncbi:hypothetical protein [Corynebacterium sp. HMSC078H07]|uniref:hypothetical protein n=1 Tax=Corynebacterium sp. HMSC078H07 TaxID=1739379 RepID=UPI0008A61748|nr:hypothetical protein [Corynebacterium sp. HMSC078H07]OFR63744.1 hypothetical protein HMPREF2875_12215 [Corynebacterium sp. HMSC078H07]